MKLISVNVGRPRPVSYRGGIIETGIFKSPVIGPVHVGPKNLEGDEQADLTVHGGVDKAVYVYPSEHYPFWRRELGDAQLPWGMFGENLTMEGLLESDVRVGDRLRIGSATFVVTRPRMPCFKLGIRFGRPDMAGRFWHGDRPGFYLAIAAEGSIEAGDVVTILTSSSGAPTVATVFRAAIARNTELDNDR